MNGLTVHMTLFLGAFLALTLIGALMMLFKRTRIIGFCISSAGFGISTNTILAIVLWMG